jgi:hypothetical protein
MEEVEFLREEARRCRRLAAGTAGTAVSRTLTEMGEEYDRKADELLAKLRPGEESRTPSG